MAKNKFYVTTPIYYVTARPHLGSLYSTLLADFLARWNKLQGKKTFFLTGTDEHGQKVAEAAHKAGKEPKAFVDGFISSYKNIWAQYQLEYDCFIRTTDTYHVKAVQEWIKRLQKKGDIYKGFYEGWYCTPCETFVTEKNEQQEDETSKGPLCPSCGRSTVLVSEETYFFKLSAYQDKLLKFYEDNPNFIVPKERAQEVINFVKQGLKDLSISRTTISWGIPFPGDKKHVAYVWADALNNYITAIGYAQEGKQKDFDFWWPAHIHVMGKDIVRFHAIYWPAFLMASDLALPKQLLVHGWIKVDKQKMSKSLGNAVDPQVLSDTYGADPVRYYLLRQIATTHDSEFSISDLEQRISSDLANDLGNLLNRMVLLAQKYDVLDSEPPKAWSAEVLELRDECLNTIEDFASYIDECLFHMALARLWKFINKVNAYFHSQEPWKLAKKERAQFLEVISATAHSLYVIGHLLWPVMPKKMEQLLDSLGVTFTLKNDTLEDLELGIWNKKFILKRIPALFEKPENLQKKSPFAKALDNGEQQETKDMPQQEKTDVIKIDDVIKVHLVVGTIEECELVENSDKLLKFQVNFGDKGMRQILAGLQKFYKPEDLIGKQAIFIFNLKPRKMAGLESQGMMLVAKNEQGGLELSTVAHSVPNGTRLQ